MTRVQLALAAALTLLVGCQDLGTGPRDSGSDPDAPVPGEISFKDFRVGQRSRYAYFITAKFTETDSIIYQPDTLIAEIVRLVPGGFEMQENYPAGSGRYKYVYVIFSDSGIVFSGDSWLVNFLTLQSVLSFALPRGDIPAPELLLSSSFPVVYGRRRGFVRNYQQFGRAYYRLNFICAARFDGGNDIYQSYLYSNRQGLVRVVEVNLSTFDGARGWTRL
jgi:hypothetical protein